MNTETWERGIAHFNAGRYWEAHESWEAGWIRLAEPEKTWVQAQIQVAGSLHLRPIRPGAADRLWASALEKMARTGGAMAAVRPRIEIDLSTLRASLVLC